MNSCYVIEKVFGSAADKLYMTWKQFGYKRVILSSLLQTAILVLSLSPYHFVSAVHESLESISQSNWSLPQKTGTHLGGGVLESVSCSSAIDCYAVDAKGQEIHFDGTGWSAPVSIDNANVISSISCPSATFCVAVDESGNALTYNGTSWSLPSQIDSDYGSFTSVSCASATFCVAVDSNGYAYFYNGTAWTSKQIDPNNYLQSISCPSPTFCAAVDDAENVMTYNGTTFSSPSAMYQLYSGLVSVSCASSSFCVAVDYGSNVFSYNGTVWSGPVYQDPTGTYYSSVSCPTVSFCVAVDESGPTISTFNSGTWSSLNGLDANGVNSVDCVSSDFCIAVDTGGDTTSFNGTSWSPPLDVDGLQTSISCSSNNSCMAVDSGGTSWLWQNSAWNSMVANEQRLVSISCVPSSVCMAVSQKNTAVEFNGSSWLSPIKIDSYVLTSVSCASATFCVAVDNFGQALFWNGSSWSSPMPVILDYQLSSISCVSTTFCMAVGTKPVLWNGSTWSIPPRQTPTILTSWDSISCSSASFCLAVDGFGNAFEWNGSIWSSNINIDSNHQLLSVSCPSAMFCVAVDNVGNAFMFNGQNWSSGIDIDTNIMLTAVSCSSAGFCIALDIQGNYSIYSTVPTLTSISPTSGPQVGGQSFTISGTNFSTASGGTTIDFGSTPATSVSCSTTTSCSGTTPSGPPGGGNVGVTATTSGGTSGAATYTYIAPTLTSISPTFGPDVGGTTVTLTGTGFDTSGGTTVSFGSTAATSVSCSTTTSCSAVSPVGPPSGGAVLVTVTTGGGTSSGVNFDYSVSPGYTPLAPYRICDTRASNNKTIKQNQCDTSGASPIGASKAISVAVAGYNSPYLASGETPVPKGATAVVLNVTAIGGSSPSYLSVCPGGESLSTCSASSSLNFVVGQNIPNSVTVELNSSGYIEIYNFAGSANVAIDVEGYYTTLSGSFSSLSITTNRSERQRGNCLHFCHFGKLAPPAGFEPAHPAPEGATFCPLCPFSRLQCILFGDSVHLVLISPPSITYLIGNIDRQCNTPDPVKYNWALCVIS
ncbi:MAG: IPT/TIG domain-containing protein [Actinobacteria bacterium]|nr:IPT/TIG domain-containing protein [Actinomycetota bacterium]MCL6105207.1 IPT/TIG domain-containing protein [Actinomycetota bacterium]